MVAWCHIVKPIRCMRWRHNGLIIFLHVKLGHHCQLVVRFSTRDREERRRTALSPHNKCSRPSRPPQTRPEALTSAHSSIRLHPGPREAAAPVERVLMRPGMVAHYFSLCSQLPPLRKPSKSCLKCTTILT